MSGARSQMKVLVRPPWRLIQAVMSGGIGAAQGLGGCRQAREMEAERGLGRYTDAVARDMPEQDGAGGLTWADNSNTDAARRMPGPASVVVGDPSTVVVINVDGLGCCGCA